ncbi:MAG: hypothetical protein WCA21_02625 [Terracidiphilus sp.]
MRFTFMLPAIMILACAASRAQVVPAAAGPAAAGGQAGVQASGTLRYALRYTQIAQFYNGPQGNAESSTLSGDASYQNANPVRPFSLTYVGGRMWNNSGGSYGLGYFQHLLVSQGILKRHWSLNLSNDVSLMPEAPITGFAGIPGVSGPPSVPGQPSQQILTLNTRSVDNMSTVNFTRSIDHATSLSATGSYGILRFPDGNGLQVNQLLITPQIIRRLNALNSIFCSYSLSRFSYPGYAVDTDTQSFPCGYLRIWNRRFSTSISAGPERVSTSGGTATPPTIGLFLSAGVNYQQRSTSAALSYTQTTTGNGGALIAFGSRNHDVNANFSRQFGKNLTISAFGAYMRTQALIEIGALNLNLGGVTNSKFGGASASRPLGRYLNINASYTAVQQSSSATLLSNAILGLSQTVSFGIGYTPREKHFK